MTDKIDGAKNNDTTGVKKKKARKAHKRTALQGSAKKAKGSDASDGSSEALEEKDDTGVAKLGHYGQGGAGEDSDVGSDEASEDAVEEIPRPRSVLYPADEENSLGQGSFGEGGAAGVGELTMTNQDLEDIADQFSHKSNNSN